MNFKKYHVSKNLFDVSTVEKGRIDNGEVGYVSQTSSLTIEGGTVSFTTTATYRGVCSGFFEIPEGTETIAFNFTRNEALGVKFVFYDSAKIWLNQDYTPTLADIPPATANIPTGAKYVRLSFTGQIVGGYSYTMSDIMLNTGSTPLPYEPYSSEVWHDIPYYLHNTSTDAITTLPADIYPTGTTATVGLKGNEQHTGTPTPDNPIMPQGTGERTGNLFDKNATNVNNGYIANGYLRSDGSINTNTDYHASEYIRISQNQRYTLYYGALLNSPSVCFYDSAKNYISGIAYANRWDVPFTTPQNAEYLRLSFRAVDPSSVILNLGSIRLPYEPYGIKIPISSANTTTPVYLGEVETTRKIKKLVLTGEESFFRDREREGSWRFYSDALISAKDNTAICSHFENIGSDGVNNSDNIGFCIFYRAQFGCRVSKSIAGTVNEFKAWLAQQYAAGTPVCVWYVLANEETGIVNEPLMKIGDYADTLSNVSIPVTAGGDTLSVGTTVQPSEVTVNYKGWHPVADVHERESGAWT